MTISESRRPSTLATAARIQRERALAAEQMEELLHPAPSVSTADRAVAWALLDRALAGATSFTQALDAGGAVLVIETPSWEWVTPIRKTLEAHMGSNDECAFEALMSALGSDDDGEEDDAPASLEPARPEWLWFSWSRDRNKEWNAAEVEQVTSALARGKGIIVVTAAADDLPSILRFNIDHRLVVPPLDGATLSLAAHVLDGKRPSTAIPDHLCELLDPDVIRFAKRGNEDGDAWITRLHSFASLTALVSKDDGPTLADIHGMDAATSWGLDLVHDMKEFTAGRLSWKEVDRGCLLYGPPGTGKTTFARALARTAGLPLITGSHGAWQAAGHQGQMLAAMRSTFEKARAAAPCILFLDEIDSFPDRASLAGRQRDYTLQVVNGLLELMDGALSRPGVVVLAAANSLNLDPALIRPGRLDRTIMVPLPSDDALAKIVRHHLGPDHLADMDLAPFFTGVTASGAQCEFWVRCAKREARRTGRPMTIDDLIAQIPRPEDLPSELQFRIAVHESGHAIVAALELPGAVELVKVEGQHCGVQFKLGHFSTQDEARRHIRVLLGGRAAEELRFGSVGLGSGGSTQSDLARATSVATAMIAGHGLGSRLLWLGDADPDTISAFLRAYPSLADEVSRLLAVEHEQVMALLRPRVRLIDEMASILVAHGTMIGAEVEELVSSVRFAQE